MRRAAGELAVFLIYLLVAVLLTWPLATSLSTAVSDLGDPLLNAWILDWDAYALTHQPLSLYDAPMFHPGRLPLAYSENLIALSVLVLPFALAGMTPIALLNIAMLLGFAASGYGTFVLARLVSRHFAGSFAAGLFFAFVGFKFDHLPHLQVVFSAWVPLLLAALLVFWRMPTFRNGALLAAAWILNGLTNIYFLLFLVPTFVLTIALFALIGERRDLRFWRRLAASLGAAMLILLPFLLPYRIVSRQYEMKRTIEEVRTWSATWTDWLVATPASRLYGRIADPDLVHAERKLFPGLAILFLAAGGMLLVRRTREEDVAADASSPSSMRGRVGWIVLIAIALTFAYIGAVADHFVVRVAGSRLLYMTSSDIPMMVAIAAAIYAFRRELRAFARRSRFTPEEWAASLWILVGVLGSLGLNAFFYTFLYNRLGPFGAMRVPARFAIVAYAGLAVWGAIGIRELTRRVRLRRQTFAAIALVLCVTIDILPMPIRWEQAVVEPAPVYRWLAKARVAPIVELPIWGDGMEFQYLLGSTTHRLPLVNGTSGFAPPEQAIIRIAEKELRYDELLRLVERSGTKVIVVHADALRERRGAVVEWLRSNLASGRLAFLRRFDHDFSGDYVFAITRNFADWRKHRAPEVPDGAGHMPLHQLERFLDAKATYSNSAIAYIEEPKQLAAIEGPLRVKGWTVAPQGIRRVTVLLNLGRIRLDATMHERPDVKALYTWYYFTSKPGFELVIPRRPRFVPPRTDVQLEIEDEAGRITRTRDILIEWR